MPSTVPIPAWNTEGILPPIDVAAATSANRSPYVVSLSDFILRFSTSAERIQILRGFLSYREALHEAGLTKGFQWIDGSFAEHVEVCPRRHRSPNDVDVVTFYRLPEGLTQAELVANAPELFPSSPEEQAALKREFLVDGYMVSLSIGAERLVERSSYWHGVWGHQRETLHWKGFLQINLDPADDFFAFLSLPADRKGGAS